MLKSTEEPNLLRKDSRHRRLYLFPHDTLSALVDRRMSALNRMRQHTIRVKRARCDRAIAAATHHGHLHIEQLPCTGALAKAQLPYGGMLRVNHNDKYGSCLDIEKIAPPTISVGDKVLKRINTKTRMKSYRSTYKGNRPPGDFGPYRKTVLSTTEHSEAGYVEFLYRGDGLCARLVMAYEATQADGFRFSPDALLYTERVFQAPDATRDIIERDLRELYADPPAAYMVMQR